MQNPTITNNIYIATERPMREEGVERVRSYLKGEEGSAVTITREDTKAMQAFTESGLGTVPELPVGRPTASRVFLNPVRGDYDGTNHAYKFTRGESKVTAPIRDEAFLARLRNGSVRFHHTDVLEVELVETQSLKGTKVDTKWEITRVFDYKTVGDRPLFDSPE